MPRIDRVTDIVTTSRVKQAMALFDMEPQHGASRSWDVNMPIDEKPWQVGLIVGPSGSGKSTIAKEMFGDSLVTEYSWPDNKSILDGFSTDLGIKEVVANLNGVGLSSAPAWMRPFIALSNGEQFRATLARALAEAGDRLVVMDEFSSVVDRQVAQFASHAVQKQVRRKQGKFVAVTCHYDVLDWLQPDWVYQPHTGEFTWRCLQQRPDISINVYAANRSAWPLFSHHHYLSSELLSSAKCIVATLSDDTPVAFLAWRRFPHAKRKNIMMAHRTVVLPDFQGVGISGVLSEWVGEKLAEEGQVYRYVTSHPAMLSYLMRSPRWKIVGKNTMGDGRDSKRGRSLRALTQVSFEYVRTIP